MKFPPDTYVVAVNNRDTETISELAERYKESHWASNRRLYCLGKVLNSINCRGTLPIVQHFVDRPEGKITIYAAYTEDELIAIDKKNFPMTHSMLALLSRQLQLGETDEWELERRFNKEMDDYRNKRKSAEWLMHWIEEG